MKVLYIVERYGTKSETFVEELLDGFSNYTKLSLVIDKDLGYSADKSFSIYETGFVTKYSKLITYINFLSKIFFRKNITTILKKRIAYKRLFSTLQNINPDIAYIDFGPNAVLSYEVLNHFNIPFVVHFHGYDASQKLNDLDYKKDINKVFNYAKLIIVASEFIKNRLVFAGCDNDKISIVRLGVDPDRLTKAGEAAEKTSYPSLIHVGRLVEKKNPIILLHTFRKVLEHFPNSKLTIIGDGPMYSEVIEFINKFNIEKSVRLIPSLKRNEVLRELASHWIYTQHCVTGGNGDQEGFSVSILEASFYKLPIVSTLHNGIPENVIDGKTGFLVREYDYKTMAKKIIYLLNNKKIMIKMGEYGSNRVFSEFNHARRVDELIGLLSSQLS